MSLLMDALKKAEQAKQQGQSPVQDKESGGTEPQLELEPIGTAAPAPTPNSLPELPTQLEVLDHQFIAHAEEASRSAPPKSAPAPRQPAAPPRQPTPAKPGGLPETKPAASSATSQAAAQNVFAAKQPAARGNKTFAIAMGVFTVTAIAGIGIYFWWQLQPAGGIIAAPRPLPPMPAPAPIAAATPPAAAPPAVEAPRLPDPAPAAVLPALRDTPSEPASLAGRPAATEPGMGLRIESARPRVNPAVAQGFAAFTGGDLAAAKAAYGKALKMEPKNADALHGLAAIALRQGQGEQAEGYFQLAAEADPKDALAQANLIALRGQGDPVAAESRLKTLLATQEEMPFLHFTLGNLYSRQERWSEAQQAYFRAVSGDPDHPDYLFNLAVSLDQLRQAKLAAQYYNQALAATKQRPAGFDKAQVAARLRELQP